MPSCNDCARDGKFRCSVKMPTGTKLEDAEFVENGIAYGFTYFFCKSCLKKRKKIKWGKNLHVWGD